MIAYMLTVLSIWKPFLKQKEVEDVERMISKLNQGCQQLNA
jgi:hypothetical protein